MTVPRRYLPPDLARSDAQAEDKQYGSPRPGHGTVYVSEGRNTHREFVWTAEWIDEYSLPQPDGTVAGRDGIEGDRQEVLSWARSRPAPTKLYASRTQPDWTPLPADDESVN